jgi:putative hydrolase of the HAD superfamily
MIHLARIKAITLDLDDTLWPVWPTIERAEQALQQWLSEHAPATAHLCSNPQERMAIRQQVNQQYPEHAHDLSFLRREAIRESLRRAGNSTELAEAAFEVFFSYRHQVTLYDGVAEALQRLSSKYALIALSNGNADVFKTDAAAHFKAAVSAREVGVAKPDVRIFHAAALQAAVAPEEVLHVGDDMTADVYGALQAGMQAVWINRDGHAWGHDGPQPLTVHHLSELCDHLQA